MQSKGENKAANKMLQRGGGSQPLTPSFASKSRSTHWLSLSRPQAKALQKHVAFNFHLSAWAKGSSSDLSSKPGPCGGAVQSNHQ
ncbi:hypothetical protein CEXT_172181 [Caerostris extrusa]|uniref:Uncharacterized protein n=1 Tax=Caerostris extrusa TaxID=172846 RepID=A0AAV4X848_CAEEX|nr:hypothetical protein CEXT_172181 [Caerostris extrusa]